MEEPENPSWLKKDVYEWPSPKGIVTRNPDDWWITEGWDGHLHHYTPTTTAANSSKVTRPLPVLPLLPELQEKEEVDKIQDSTEVVLPRMMPVMEDKEENNMKTEAAATTAAEAEAILNEPDTQWEQFDSSHLPHIKDNRFIKQDAEEEEDVQPLPELPLLPELQEQEEDVSKIQGDTEDSTEVVLPRMMPVMENKEENKNKTEAAAAEAEAILNEPDAQWEQFDFSHLPHIKDNRFIKQDVENWTPGHHLGSWSMIELLIAED